MIKEEIIEYLGNKFDSDVEDLKLLQYLRDYRNSIHPDKHPEKDQTELNERVVRANQLIDEFKKYIGEKSTNLVLRGEIIKETPYDQIFELIELETERNELLSLKNTHIQEINKLNREIEKLSRNKSDQKMHKQLNEIKATRKEIGILTSTLGLVAVIALLNQVVEISNVLSNIIPFDIIYLNYALFAFIILFSVKILLRNLMSHQLREVIEVIQTRKVRINFLSNIENQYKYYFNELDLLGYLKEYIKENYSFLNIVLFKLNFANKRDVYLDLCTDIFLESLLRENIIVSETTDRPVKTYSLKKINYNFEYKDIEISDYNELIS